MKLLSFKSQKIQLKPFDHSFLFCVSAYLLSLASPLGCSQSVTQSQQEETPKERVIVSNTEATYDDLPKFTRQVPNQLNFLTLTESKLLGPQGVERWEPSGVVSTESTLWVVSDREGWLTQYQLPIKPGSNSPIAAHQIKPPLKNRLKWEGLEWSRDSNGEINGLLLLEAISRTVWRCERPEEGCPVLTRLDPEPLNELLNTAVKEPFQYIMFEALAYLDEPLVGVRGFQHKTKGLTPWSLLSNFKGGMILDARETLVVDKRRYGLSGATYDRSSQGFWLTWSYEEEEGVKRDAVSGFLSFSPLRIAKQKGSKEKIDSKNVRLNGTLEYGDVRIEHLNQGQFKLCARFGMKPEGVAVNDAGLLFVVFDEDRDRKAGKEQVNESDKEQSGRFPLLSHQDYIFTQSVDTTLKACQ